MFAEFKRAGIFDTLKEQSKAHSGGISFRRTVDQQLIERIPPIPGRPGPIVVPQKQFTETLIAQMGKLDKATLCMGTKVVGVEETAGGVEVEAEDVTTGEKKNFRAKWLVGADGGNSFVRRTLGIKYEGLDLPYKLVAADVVYPFQKYGFDGANFMLDEENFGNIAVTSELDDENWLWRVGCAFPDSMSDEEIMAALPKKFDAMFPGPRPLNYELKGAAPYKAAQLCVPSFRKGRTLLIGDAAHCEYCLYS
jgi:2-polyprenyl-6-methoxyphenol hydroxylase-like FAD-dependent oxidoreductase